MGTYMPDTGLYRAGIEPATRCRGLPGHYVNQSHVGV